MRLSICNVLSRSAVIRALATFAICAGICDSASAVMTITPTFTANFNSSFGANAAAAQAAWIAAASVFTANFDDNIHINIRVDGVAGTSIFGSSSWSTTSTTYANLRAKVVADATTADDNTAIGAGGSMTAADPTGGTGTWSVTRAEAKALGIIPDDTSTIDGTTTFGAGYPFFFTGGPVVGMYDFQGVAAHEISEVMGRIGFSGPSSYSLIDDFAYTANAKNIGSGPGVFFSIDNGTTLLKLYNNQAQNGLDTRDWARLSDGGDGSPDAFNQFSNSNVINAVTPVDLRVMDVIGYNLVPEPSSYLLLAFGAAGLVAVYRRRSANSCAA